MQIMCNINNVCVEIPFRVEWPMMTKEKRIDKIPNVLNKTQQLEFHFSVLHTSCYHLLIK